MQPMTRISMTTRTLFGGGTERFWFGLAAGLLLTAAARGADARFAVISSTIDTGGGSFKATNGRYAIEGTLGQAEAGAELKSTDSRYVLEPGFWTGITLIQTPDAPLLKIRFVKGNAVISWPMSVTGFALQENSDLGNASSWIPTPVSVVDTATEHTVTLPAVGVVKSFRLSHN